MDKSAGGAGIYPMFAKRDTSPTMGDNDNDKGKLTPRILLDKTKNAGGASEEINKLKAISGTLEIMDDDRSMAGTERMSGKTRTTASFEILDNQPTLDSTSGAMEKYTNDNETNSTDKIPALRDKGYIVEKKMLK